MYVQGYTCLVSCNATAKLPAPAGPGGLVGGVVTAPLETSQATESFHFQLISTSFERLRHPRPVSANSSKTLHGICHPITRLGTCIPATATA